MSPVPPSKPAPNHQDEHDSRSHYSHSLAPPNPLVRLHLDDISNKATRAFLSAVEPPALLEQATKTVLKWLYDFHESHTSSATLPVPETPITTPPWPPVRSITLVLRSMSGVAYTTSILLDQDHKEVHLSLDYLVQAARSDRLRDEITGVVVHEMVHVWQSYAEGSAPGGLTEGIADWVRLRAGLAPPHWKRQAGEQGRAWDDGYETTGWFLDWLETVRVGEGTVRRCNARLRDGAYDEKTFWTDICGEDVDVLWKEYGDWLRLEKDKEGQGANENGSVMAQGE